MDGSDSMVSSLNVSNATLTVKTKLEIGGSAIIDGVLTIESPGLVIDGVSPIFVNLHYRSLELMH